MTVSEDWEVQAQFIGTRAAEHTAWSSCWPWTKFGFLIREVGGFTAPHSRTCQNSECAQDTLPHRLERESKAGLSVSQAYPRFLEPLPHEWASCSEPTYIDQHASDLLECAFSSSKPVVLQLPNAVILEWNSSCCGDPPTIVISVQFHHYNFATVPTHNVNI
ncbi:hypothetical protein STEG23_024704 [Scotinomys teguina]